MNKYAVVKENKVSRVVVCSDERTIKLRAGEKILQASGRVRVGDHFLDTKKRPNWFVVFGIAGPLAVTAIYFAIKYLVIL